MKSRCERQHVEPHGCQGLGINCPICHASLHKDKVSGQLVVGIDLWYPGVNDENPNPEVIQVGLMHVRAADDIRIEYDFDRDGWVIKQASTFGWPGDDTVCDEDWQEVAFVKAWARERWDGHDDLQPGMLVMTKYGVGRVIEVADGPGSFYRQTPSDYCAIRILDSKPDPLYVRLSIGDLQPGPVGHVD